MPMLSWIVDNLWTVVICAGVIALVALLIRSLIRDRRAGKSSCCGSCAGCTGCAHATEEKPRD